MPDMKIAAALPQELDDNGLYVIKRALMRHPDEQHLVIAVVDCKSTSRVGCTARSRID